MREDGAPAAANTWREGAIAPSKFSFGLGEKMIVLIGSTALNYHLNLQKIPGRIPKDIDFIAEVSDLQNICKNADNAVPFDGGKKFLIKKLVLGQHLIYEAELALKDSTAAQVISNIKSADDDSWALGYYHWDGFDIPCIIPSIHLLYELKLSHRYKKNSVHFLKTMRDIQLLRKLGAEIKHPEFLKAREKETYTYAHPKLKTSKVNFFKENGNVRYVYDHDSVHLAMKHLDKPAYEYFKENKEEVFTSKNLFDSLPHKIKLYAVLEESYVLALERSQIPYPGKLSPQESFEIALMKVCTSITSGWFREFAWENYDEVMKLFQPTYVEHFQRALERGIVKPA
jgi:hypothetical protein